jgi:hypothetical protein
MDDVDKIPYMIEFSEKLNIDQTLEWLGKTWVQA